MPKLPAHFARAVVPTLRVFDEQVPNKDQAVAKSAKPKSKPAPKKPAKPAAKAAAKPAAKPKPAPKPPATKAPVKPAPKPAPAPGKPAAAPAKPAIGKGPAPAAAPAAAPKAAAVPAAAKTAPIAPAAATGAPAAAEGDAKKKNQGITVVTPKPNNRKPKPKKITVMPTFGTPLLKPGARHKPLISSGPRAEPINSGHAAGPKDGQVKSPFAKKELDRFREILLRKRAELVGDVKTMESEALKGSAGSLSHLPQHMAEQGTDNFEQSITLDLAAADRTLIREIDDAIKRIDNNTFGVCEFTHKPINKERLEELPWTRFSIEGARERERRTFVR